MKNFSYRIGRSHFTAFKAFSKLAQRISTTELTKTQATDEAKWRFEFFQIAGTLGDVKSLRAIHEDISSDDTLKEMVRIDLILRQNKSLTKGYKFAAGNDADNQILDAIVCDTINAKTRNVSTDVDPRLWCFALRLAAAEMVPSKLADVLSILPNNGIKKDAFQHLQDLLILKADFGNVSIYRADAELIVKMCTAWLDPACHPYNADDNLIKVSLSRGLVRIGQIETAHRTLLAVSPNKAGLVRASILTQTSIRQNKIPEAISYASETIQRIAKLPPNFDEEVNFNTKNAESALIRVNDLLRGVGLKPFVMSGTLLGMIREGRIFAHDKDFDIGLIGWEAQYDVAQALLLDGNFVFDIHDLKGHNTFMLPVVDKITNISFDIFFYHDKGTHFLHGIDSRYGYTQNFIFSKFDLIEKTFMENKFYLPDNYTQNLSENYGSDWHIPQPNYFVKIQSPAISEKEGIMFTLVAYLEMIFFMRANPSKIKGDALLNRILSTLQPKDHPNLADIDAYKKYFSRLKTDQQVNR
jgi:hypothetical protein